MYKPGGVNMKVFVINIESEEVDGPCMIRVNAGETVKELKVRLANMLNMDANIIKVNAFIKMKSNRLNCNIDLFEGCTRNHEQ